MCDLRGCEREGRNVPQIVVTVRDRISRQKWTIAGIVSLRICDECKASVTEPTDVLADGGQRIVDALLKMRHTASFVSKRLDWTTTANPDYRKLLESRPS